MSNRKLVLAAVALILGVVASVSWYLAAEAAARRAVRDERQPPLSGPSLSQRSTGALRAYLGASPGTYPGQRVGLVLARRVAEACPCRLAQRS